MLSRLTPVNPRVEIQHQPDGTTRTVVVERWRIEGATSFAPGAHTPVRAVPLP